MVALGVTLLLLCPAAAPEVVAGPRFAKGDELHYVGEVVESSEAVENRYRKAHALEVRLFVLETDDTSATCALLTMLTRDADPALLPGMASIAGQATRKIAMPTSVRLDFVRIDSCGKADWLEPVPGALPIQFTRANRQAIPPLPTAAPPQWELGFLMRTPAAGAKLGTPWTIREDDQPATVWNAKAEGNWNGRRCWEVVARSESENYNQPTLAPKGWQRTDTLQASPVDGYACCVSREIVRRHGREQIGKITVKYELQPTNRYVGTRYAEARQEIETAWAMTAELQGAIAKPGKAHEYTARAAKIERYLSDHPGSGTFRIAIEALKRRAQSYAAGTVPFVAQATGHTVKKVDALAVGSAAPDFTAADVDFPSNHFRLKAAKGKPVVLIFYKPNSVTSKDALTIAEALGRRFRDTATVVPLAIGAKPEVAAAQRAELKYRVPVFDGSEVRSAYRIETFPQFIVLDGQGNLNWSFDAGVGPEVGYLVKEALENAIAEAPPKR